MADIHIKQLSNDIYGLVNLKLIHSVRKKEKQEQNSLAVPNYLGS